MSTAPDQIMARELARLQDMLDHMKAELALLRDGAPDDESRVRVEALGITGQQKNVLSLLLRRRGRFVSQETLLASASVYEACADTQLRVLISKIRKKLRKLMLPAVSQSIIDASYGAGYRLPHNVASWIDHHTQSALKS